MKLTDIKKELGVLVKTEHEVQNFQRNAPSVHRLIDVLWYWISSFLRG